MKQEPIELPSVKDLKAELEETKKELQEALKEEPDLASEIQFALEIQNIIIEKISKEKDLSKMPRKDQIFLLAHLSLFYDSIGELAHGDFDDLFDDDDFFDEDEMEEAVFEEEN